MGLFGKTFERKDTRSSGGNKHVKTTYRGGSSTTNTYRGGRLVNIRDAESNGRSHDHKVGRGMLGPFKGGRK